MSDLLEEREAGVGIAIAYADRRGLQDRCSLGTATYGIGDPGYDAYALVPADDWEPLPARMVPPICLRGHARE
jgi:hypothetical protein